MEVSHRLDHILFYQEKRAVWGYKWVRNGVLRCCQNDLRFYSRCNDRIRRMWWGISWEHFASTSFRRTCTMISKYSSREKTRRLSGRSLSDILERGSLITIQLNNSCFMKSTDQFLRSFCWFTHRKIWIVKARNFCICIKFSSTFCCSASKILNYSIV